MDLLDVESCNHARLDENDLKFAVEINKKAGPFLALPSFCRFPCYRQTPQQTWLHGDEI
jgi:hypothetical protein